MNLAGADARRCLYRGGRARLSNGQATILFESTDQAAARIVAPLGRQVGVLAVEEWDR